MDTKTFYSCCILFGEVDSWKGWEKSSRVPDRRCGSLAGASLEVALWGGHFGKDIIGRTLLLYGKDMTNFP